MALSWNRIFNVRRSPKEQILTPHRSIGYSGGVTVTEDTSMQASAFNRGVIFISSQIAKIPWNVKDKNNAILSEDNINYLLDLAPNPEMTAMDFRLLAVQTAIIHGNFYAEIERNMSGQAVAIWPIPTRNVQVMRDDTGKLVYKVVGSSTYVKGEDAYLQARDVFHIKNFHTKDGILGQGVVAYGMDILGISLGADRMAGNLFGNGGLPSGVLEVQGTLSDEAFLRMKESWKESHGGRKSGGVAVLEEGAKFTPIQMSPDVLQFLDSRKFNVLEIARFLGVPPTKLFDMEGAKFANMENSNLEVVTDCLDSWTRTFELQADIKLLNGRHAGRKSEFDLYAVFRGDMATRADYFSKMMQTGAISSNEIRQKEGMAPYEGGERYWIAVNNFSPVDKVDEIIDSQISKNKAPSNSTPSPKVDTAKAELDNELKKEALKILKGN